MTTASVSYSQLIRGNRNFRALWFGQIVSLLGDWFNLIASAALLNELTESGLAIGGLFVVRMIAPFLISPFAGVIADRYNRKAILLTTDIVRGIIVLGFLFVREPQHVWLLYLLTGLQLGTGGFFFPTKNALLPDIVREDELGAANTISSITWSTMLAVGAALGGLVAGLWGNQTAFLIDAATFFVSAVFIARMQYQTPKALAASDKSVRAAVEQYVSGLSYLRRHVDQLVTALLKGVNAILISTGFQVIQVTITERVFVIGEGGGIGLGLIFAIAGAGTGLGPLAARAFAKDRDRPMRWTIVVGWLIASVGILIVSTLASFPLVLLGSFLRGFGGGIVWVMSTQILLQLVPGHVRGRTFATEYMIFTLLSAIGAGVIGNFLDSGLELGSIMRWMAVLILIPTALWTLWTLRRPKTEPAPISAD